MTNKLDDVSQDFYDENRKLFNADTFSFDVSRLNNKCPHKFIRKSYTAVECELCHIGYLDNNRFILENGKILGIK